MCGIETYHFRLSNNECDLMLFYCYCTLAEHPGFGEEVDMVYCQLCDAIQCGTGVDWNLEVFLFCFVLFCCAYVGGGFKGMKGEEGERQ